MTEIKVRCQYCKTWTGTMTLKIAKGTEWTMIAICPDCQAQKRNNSADYLDLEGLKGLFGMK